MKIVTQKQIGEIHRKLIHDYEVPSLVLVESSASQFSEVLHLHYQPLKNKKMAVVCGNDGKGILGLAVARHLVIRHQADVEILLSEKINSYAPEALIHYKMAENFGIKIKAALEYKFESCDLIIDALYESSSEIQISETNYRLINNINMSGRPIVSVEAPSGLNTDSGVISNAVIRAQLTITSNLLKYGLLVYPAAHFVGELVVLNNGLPAALINATQITTSTIESSEVKTWLPKRKNQRDLNKSKFGHVALFAGSSGFTGAAILAAEAAQRAGAGAVTLAIPDYLEQSILSRLSPVIMTHALSQTRDSSFSVHAIEEALALVASVNAAVVGPGIGLGDEVAEFVCKFAARCPVPLVIDADALTILSKTADRGKSIIKNRMNTTVLTPHPAELASLLNITTLEVQSDRMTTVQQAAQLYKCVVVLKGSHTLISDFSGKIYVNTTGNSGLSSAGTGDVLTGVIASFLAQGLEDLNSAVAGVFIHGFAADLIAKKLGGTAGMSAVDIIRQLPQAIAKCHKLSV
jgi:hydroxyethylthiazole kinase-like uncharacterized protein yjeF